MSCTTPSHISIRNFKDLDSANQKDLDQITTWLKSIQSYHLPQNYLSIAFVIHQEIGPIIRKKESLISMQGADLSDKLRPSKDLINLLDPAFKSILSDEKTTLKERIVLTKTEEIVNNISRTILSIFHMDEYQSDLEDFCQETIAKITATRGYFNLYAKASISESPNFDITKNLDDSNELLDGLFKEGEELSLTFEKNDGFILDQYFAQGIKEETSIQLSINLSGNEINRKQTETIDKYEFCDLRHKELTTFKKLV